MHLQHTGTDLVLQYQNRQGRGTQIWQGGTAPLATMGLVDFPRISLQCMQFYVLLIYSFNSKSGIPARKTVLFLLFMLYFRFIVTLTKYQLHRICTIT